MDKYKLGHKPSEAYRLDTSPHYRFRAVAGGQNPHEWYVHSATNRPPLIIPKFLTLLSGHLVKFRSWMYYFRFKAACI